MIPALATMLIAVAASHRPAPLPAARPADDGWVDVTRFGAVGDGVHDDTEAFRSAAATGKRLRVPRPPAHYRLTGTVRVRASVVGQGMPEIRMYGAQGKESHAMLAVLGYRGPGLVIRGLHLDGQWDGAAAAGEWSHNVLVKGSTNVTIEENLLERPYGDCVLVGGENDPEPSVGVVIRRNRMIDPRRCGIALISARHVSIRQNVIRKTSEYVTAIDLEPNPSGLDAVWDVEIADNDLDVTGVAIQLYTAAAGTLPCGDVRIVGNRARARRFFVKPPETNAWSGITLAGNVYLGATTAGGDSSFAFVAAPASEVTLRANRIVPAGPGGDDFVGVRALHVLDNVWSGRRTYSVKVSDCPDARISGNVFRGLGAHP